jgi:hypothetical protein
VCFDVGEATISLVGVYRARLERDGDSFPFPARDEMTRIAA